MTTSTPLARHVRRRLAESADRAVSALRPRSLGRRLRDAAVRLTLAEARAAAMREALTLARPAVAHDPLLAVRVDSALEREAGERVLYRLDAERVHRQYDQQLLARIEDEVRLAVEARGFVLDLRESGPDLPVATIRTLGGDAVATAQDLNPTVAVVRAYLAFNRPRAVTGAIL